MSSQRENCLVLQGFKKVNYFLETGWFTVHLLAPNSFFFCELPTFIV